MTNHKCERCGISKEELKLEIINELMPIIYDSCKGYGGSRIDFERPSGPLGLGVGFNCNVPPNYANSAGVLEKEIQDLQLQIDRNYADITQAKQVYEREVDYLLKTCSLLERSTEVLEKDMVDAQRTSEKQEMYSRRNILELDGIPETPGENTNLIALKMFHALGLRNVTYKDICRSHRNGRRQKWKHRPRPIYVKIVCHDLKDAVMSRRDRLREMPSYKNVFIDENLTRRRRWLYKRVREEVGNKFCYTYDGTIYIADPNGNEPLKINNSKDFFIIFNKYPREE